MGIVHIFDGDSPYNGVIELPLWNSIVDASPLLRRVSPGEVFVDSRQEGEQRANVPLALYEDDEAGIRVALSYGLGYINLLYPMAYLSDVNLLNIIATHLNAIRFEIGNEGD